jgi:hypothetical protein
MPEVGFEPTITASARAKKVHALDGSATVTGPSDSAGDKESTPSLQFFLFFQKAEIPCGLELLEHYVFNECTNFR